MTNEAILQNYREVERIITGQMELEKHLREHEMTHAKALEIQFHRADAYEKIVDVVKGQGALLKLKT